MNSWSLSGSRVRALNVALAVVVGFVSVSWANHGPGTSGGGSSTVSGETLKQKQFELSLRVDYTKFQDVSREEAEQRAIISDEFDALDQAIITTASLGFGLTDDLQIGATIGYYSGSNFIDAEADGLGGAESSTADPSGLTDLALNIKYRFLRGQIGNVAVIGGIILPTGRDDVRLANGELLEPSSQPGTGAVAYQIGLGYSRFLTSRITIDAGGLYTIRMEKDDFEVGDRVDLGVALAYRLTESIGAFPNWSLFGEITGVWLGKDQEEGESNPNSGGWTTYLTPGVRVRINEHAAITVAPSIPIFQDLNGDQIEAQFKLATMLTFTF